MANRIEFAVIATPIVSGTISEGSGTIDLIAADMPKSLGGSGQVVTGESNPSVTVDFTSTNGYSSGTVAYKQVASESYSTMVDCAALSYDIIVIRHTGFRYSSATVLGVADTTGVIIATLAAGADVPIALLKAGEAIVLPLRSQFTGSGLGIRVKAASTVTGNGPALEIFATT